MPGGRVPYLGAAATTSGRTPYLAKQSANTGRTPYLGGAAPAKGGGLLGSIEKYSGAQLVGNLGKDIGQVAVGVGPGIYNAAKALGKDAISNPVHPKHQFLDKVIIPAIKNEKAYYGHNVFSHLYQHPLQPIVDALTVATGGAGAVAKVGKVAADVGAISKTSKLATLGERGTVTTRSPRAIATGKGPVHTDITSTSPLVKAREIGAAKVRAGRPTGTLGIGGEVKKYGKQIQAQATQRALGRTVIHEPYAKATRGLKPDEWSALHIRAMDIHPDELTNLWKGTPLEATANSPKIRNLALNPSKQMLKAEPEMRQMSAEGAQLYKQQGRLKEETAAARPDLTKRQASEMLGRPVKSITGKPYYFPHVLEPPRNVNPLAATGGGKGVPRKLGSMKENTGALALHGKLHLRGDVLGPEFLRRVKFVKYDEVHNALVRGALRLTQQELEQRHGGKLPKGYEYIREKASTKIPPTIRGEGTTNVPLEKIIPNPDDLHDSQLAKEGFSTTDPAQAHQSGGKYYIVPKTMVKAATGEFTRSSDFTRNFVKRPLSVWRAAVLGLRVGFLTNNLVGNSVMYAAKTGGKGALRDLFMAIKETHGPKVARQVLDSAATPPALRADLYKEFFPEQVRGTFGRTQTPATSAAHVAGQKTAEVARAVTGAIPRLTSKVAEEYPRRALIRNAIRHSPEFRNVYKTLPKQTRTFEQAARHVLEGKGGAAYQRFISKQVNNALGDYLNLSPFERNIMRNTLPFYSWYRAIVVTTGHLAVDTPLRANILGQLGQIGKQQSDAGLGPVPSFLKGAIPLGPGSQGTQRVLATQSLNPYATLSQLQRGGTTDLSALGLNPFVEGPMQYLQRHTGNVSPGQLVASPLLDLLKNLPPSRLIAPPGPSKLYPTRKGRKPQLWGFAGVPIKEYNPGVAATQAKQGR